MITCTLSSKNLAILLSFFHLSNHPHLGITSRSIKPTVRPSQNAGSLCITTSLDTLVSLFQYLNKLSHCRIQMKLR